MTLIFSNNAQTTIAGSITNVATSVALAPGSGAEFPNPSAGQTFVGTFNDAATGLLYEIVSVTARSTDTLTIVRAQEGTTALAWNAGDIFGNFMTAGTASAFLQAAATLLNVQKFTSTGTYTPTAGTTFVAIYGVGGGGGGGGTLTTSGGQASAGGGGSAGSFFVHATAVANVSGQTVTIGAAGAANVAGNGGNGGQTSVGAGLIAPGGVGGQLGGNTATFPNSTVGASPGLVATGGNLRNLLGAAGFSGLVLGVSNLSQGGYGGASYFAPGGYTPYGGSNPPGNPGTLGSGGSGGAISSSQSGNAGGAGGAGYVEIWEYA